MFKLDVKKNGKVVHQVGGSSREDCLAQLQPYLEHKTFGEPEEYTVEIEDITQQVILEKSKQEEKKLAKEKRKADRKAIDFDKIKTIAELKAYLKLYLDDLED